jgi:hypothetical protein
MKKKLAKLTEKSKRNSIKRIEKLNKKVWNLRKIIPDGVRNGTFRMFLPPVLGQVVVIRPPDRAPGEDAGEIAPETSISHALRPMAFQPDHAKDPAHAGLTLYPATSGSLILFSSNLLIFFRVARNIRSRNGLSWWLTSSISSTRTSRSG